MGDVSDSLIFASVVLGRFAIPLFIFRYPLPAIIASLLLDAADKAILDVFTGYNLENYQSYDKALDVYYLALAYIATLRNWAHLFAFRVGQFLWYYRLAGVALFELTGARFVLFLFPNAFEYFFIFYEAVRTRWNPLRLTRRMVLVAAAVIWVGIKLPQEFWIHVLKMDTTDAIKEHILGVPLDTGWREALGDNLWVFPVLLALVGAVSVLLVRLWRRLPEPDRAFTLSAGAHAERLSRLDTLQVSDRHWRTGLLEKIVLVSLIVIIFARMLPDVETTELRVAFGVAVVIVANAFISHLLAVRGTRWRSVITEFAALAAINFTVALLYTWLMPQVDDSLGLGALLFFNFLLTLIVVVYDRYRPIADMRREGGG